MAISGLDRCALDLTRCGSQCLGKGAVGKGPGRAVRPALCRACLLRRVRLGRQREGDGVGVPVPVRMF